MLHYRKKFKKALLKNAKRAENCFPARFVPFSDSIV